ncbi:hypothetical protein B0H66DRAFT_488127 [Apodospora peruviana]|uniref:Heterokaryon incompatibility domain-containing protein n=1 Tax=Apodospora peruviana TaxID=516989 RepID=A0AAE0IPZ6_9PEZI|nr:hypothetical protein B0H66DRAFT_488127 [Apodospora peruviana]
MDSLYPRNADEAREHIYSIRRQNGLDIPGSDPSNLENALRLISEELYQKPTHFLHELIQNADDNDYAPTTTPALSISYRDRVLQLSSNERGFSKRNVEALCKVGSSTKGGSAKALGYIGEKGIGFKSVFKVADAVWIRSGHYSFKFDKGGKLGMLAPIWADFPAEYDPGQTTLRLEMLPDYPEEDLLKELRALDARLLLFLRRLASINISVHTPSCWNTTIHVSSDATALNGSSHSIKTVMLQKNEEVRSYVIWNHVIEDLPLEPKRAGIRKSKMTLAFPIFHSMDGGTLPPQAVYAFLPIRDFGFKFLLNADFVLSASREAIVETSAWNKALRDALPRALVDAVHHFWGTDLQYSWPSLLPTRPIVDDFFGDQGELTIKLLAEMPILESMSANEMGIPRTLTMVPPRFSDGSSLPMFMDFGARSRAQSYLSSGYRTVDLPLLRRLGVREMSDDDFLDSIAAAIVRWPVEFRRHPDEWHSNLASHLMSLLASHPEKLGTVAALPVIPLCDGRWVSARDSIAVFGSTVPGKAPIPQGIDATQVSPAAYDDPNRKFLFTMLGVSEVSSHTVCEQLALMHESPSFDPKAIPGETLISHVAYMYNSRWKNPNKRDIWVITVAGNRRRGSQIYVESGGTHSISQYIREFHHLDPRYRTIASDTEVPESLKMFTSWLVDCCKLSVIPRLVESPESAVFKLSFDFEHIVKAHASRKVLLLLRDNWQYYSYWISRKRNECRHRILRYLATTPVLCTDGIHRPLEKTTLPTIALTAPRQSRHFDFVDVPDPDKDEWDFLQVFGVRIHAGMQNPKSEVGRFIDRLESLAEEDDGQGSPAYIELAAAEQYREINLRCLQELDEIRTVFRTRKLIYYHCPGSDRGTWCTSAECRWTGDKALQKTPLLMRVERYTQLRSFFAEALLVVNTADVETVVEELLQVSLTDRTSYITGLLMLLQRSLPDGREELHDLVQKLRHQNIFPILRGKGSLGSDFDSLESDFEELDSNNKDDSFWNIADRPHLRKCFEGLLPLLSISETQFPMIRRVLDAFGLLNRCLSKRVSRKVRGDGDPRFLEDFTMLMRKKVQFIARIIPRANGARTSVLERLLRIDVYQVQNLDVQWSVKTPDGTVVTGRPEQGSGTVEETDVGLEILLTRGSSRLSLPIDVVEDLVNLFGTMDAETTGMLHYILMEHNLAYIEDTLDRRGIEADPDENWLTTDILTDDPRGKCPRHFRRRRGVDQTRINVLDQLEDDKMTRILMAKRWEGNPAEKVRPLLKHLCLLDDQDPSMFLPTTFLDGLIDRNGDDDDDDDYNDIKTKFHAGISDFGVGEYSRTIMSVPAVLRLSRKNERQWVVYGPPKSPFDDEMMFFGELYISRLLEVHLGKAYVPEKHWTSSLRTRAGFRPVPTTSIYVPAFTIRDKTNSLRKFLTSKGLNVETAKSVSHIKFHIDVITAEGELEDNQFFIHPKHLEDMKKHCLLQEGILDEKVPVLPLLIAVHRVSVKPSAVILVDPFGMYLDGSLNLGYPAHIPAKFNSLTLSDHLVLDDFAAEKGCKVSLRKRIMGQVTGSAGFAFQYHPLPSHRSVRLLYLDAIKEKDDSLRGRVHVVQTLESAPEYVALSYVWGAGLKPYRLDTPDGVVWLTASCDSALRSIRSTKKQVCVWVDAVCIDQSNAHEKAIQIRLMRDVFRTARYVYGWVGEEEGDSRLAMETLRQIHALVATKLDASTPWPADLRPAPDGWADSGIPGEGDESWPAVERFFDRSYFKRAWITQEVVLAQDVRIICGTYRTQWAYLYDGLKIAIVKATRLMEANKFRSGAILQKAERAALLGKTRRLYSRKKGSTRLDFQSLIERFAHTEASIDRDKLFALVGLASNTDHDVFDPDYTSSLEVVVRRYAAEFVIQDRVFDLLHRAGTTKGYSFASWIPAWTEPTQRRTISTWHSTKGRFSAHGDTGIFAAVVSHADQKLLQVTTTSVDTIQHVGKTTLAESDIWTVLNEIVRSLQALKTYPTGEAIADVQARLPIGDASRPYHEKAGDLQPHQESSSQEAIDGGGDTDWAPSALLIPSIQSLFTFLRGPGDDCANMWKYWQTASAFSLRLGHARFATTSRGYAGLVPPDTEPGDTVAIIHGGAVPFVIRKGRNEASSKLVGECYVHGIMHGEAMSLADAEEQTIRLV